MDQCPLRVSSCRPNKSNEATAPERIAAKPASKGSSTPDSSRKSAGQRPAGRCHKWTHEHPTIKGEKKFEHEEEKEGYQRMERYYGNFRRSVRLPDSIDDEKVVAKLDKGILTVKLAKPPEAVKEERKIKIKSG